MKFQQNIPLDNKNWFKTGGVARFYCEPQTPLAFQSAVCNATKNNLSIFVLGHGANILIADTGFNGLVIRPALNAIQHTIKNNTDVLVTAGAGASIADLIHYCLNNNIIGLEEFSGIPGTVGGSVYINLHYFEFLLEQFLLSAKIIDKRTGIISTVLPEWFGFGYNKSKLHKKNHYLLQATFKLKRATNEQTAFARGRSHEIIRHRAARYPQTGTCGSFFRNFYANEVTKTSGSKKLIWVAYYLDKIGIKGQLTCGGASVSYQHANMIVNNGSATSTDIIMLARQMQQKVFNEFGLIPQPECQLIGFDEYPLLKDLL